jgi:integrase
MASYKFKRKSPRAKDGLCPIVLVYNYNRSKRSEISTGIFIQKEDWDEKREQIKRKHPDFVTKNDMLQEMTLRIQQIIYDLGKEGEDPSTEIVTNRFKGYKKEENVTKSFFELLQNHIEIVTKQHSYNTLKDYKALNKYLIDFEKFRKRKVTISEINYRFYEELISFLQHDIVKRNGEKGLADGSVGKYVKNFRLFLKRCYQRGYIRDINTQDWKVFTSEGAHVFVTNDELNALIALDFAKNEKLDKIRDLFVVACETGLRWGDFSCISPYAIKERTIELISKKTETFVRIPIHPRLRTILEKYDNHLPHYTNLAVFNVKIKEICEAAGLTEMIQQTNRKAGKLHEKWSPKYQLISAHTGRRSFCTNSYLSGMDKDLIMSISGHSSEKMLMRYVKVSKEEMVKEKLEEYLAGIEMGGNSTFPC